MIRIQKLNKFFNRGKQNEIHVINDVTLELPEKGMVAVFGKSGCGKTTLLNVIGGLDSFSGGKLTIEENDIRKNTDEIRNKYIGYIFQNYNLHKHESCYDNVADALRLCGMNDKAEIEERVMAALSNVGMEKFRSRNPDTLSGGQQQRIAIARAIVKNPKIILADEPTGNLDEANTVMIMDLLKAISKDHLVILVTHEANLVDYYCDTVIELADGKVVNVKNNSGASGFSAKDKNDIYLGELERTELQSASAEIEYYGEIPNEPVKLKIVNSGGKLYVQINTPKVQVLDSFSEVRLRDGVYEEKINKDTLSENIDMSKLTHIEGKRFGRLFTLRSSVKSGYVSNFDKSKRGKKVLRGCMCLFAAVIVLMTSLFGNAFKDIINAKEAYNHNVFYIYTPSEEVSDKIYNAVGNENSGIDYIRLNYGMPSGDLRVQFMLGFFETFSTSYYDESFSTNAVYLGAPLAEELELVAGKKDGLVEEEILITTAVADSLLKKSSLGYIKEYKDLIGLISNNLSVENKNLRVAGVVKSNETAVYLSELYMAKYVMNSSNNYVLLDSDCDMELSPGKAVMALRYTDENIKYPTVGEKIKINGTAVEISDVRVYVNDYTQWLDVNGIKKMTEDEYFSKLIKEKYPQLSEIDEEFYDKFNEMYMNNIFEYREYYYSEIDAFLSERYFFESDYFELYLAVEKNIEAAKYYVFGDDEYYKAKRYKELYGKGEFPTYDELYEVYDSIQGAYDDVSIYYDIYSSEFYSNSRGFYSNCFYIVDESDYISFSKTVGETHESAKANYYSEEGKYYEDDMIYMTDLVYTVIHSSDPDKTESFIRENFSDLSADDEYIREIIVPNDIFDYVIEEKRVEIMADLITMAVVLVIMCICMYFIMRSSLMNRIKEVGIYRAIGVSKKNLIFNFCIESLVLATLTVVVGFILMSLFIWACFGLSSLVSEIFFYPAWLAVLLLGIIYLLCVVCGVLPISSLLRKTPSAILAKYDI